MDCLFCKIIAGDIPSAKVYEDEYVYAFEDIDKKAPVHILVVPKKHFASIVELNDDAILAKLFEAVRKIAKDTGIDKTGFRTVMNTGEDGGQTVNHLHIHILGGRELQWPPG